MAQIILVMIGAVLQPVGVGYFFAQAVLFKPYLQLSGLKPAKSENPKIQQKAGQHVNLHVEKSGHGLAPELVPRRPRASNQGCE